MKNWFLSKSLAVRAAMIVLAAAVVTGAGAGVYLIATNLASNDSEVTTIADSATPMASPVINDIGDSDDEAIDEENADKGTEAIDTEAMDMEGVELEYTAYQKTSNTLENGNFSNGTDAWEIYSYVENNINFTADGYLALTMNETGSEDWHVQVKQNGIRLEKGKWYTISFDAKSTLGRTILCSMQRDGMIHNDDWTPYANAKEYTLTSNWQTFTYTFQMNENTDNAAVMMFSFGTINGRKITTEHTICLDNVKLTQLADNWTDSLRVGDNLIANANFEYESTMWDASVVAPGAAQVSFVGNKASFDITNVGTVDWHVQLKQGGIKLEQNQGYRLTFTASSAVARTIKIGFMDTEYVNWYGGGDVVLNGTDDQVVTVDFYNSIGNNDNALFMLSMGLIDGVDTPAGKITFSNFSLVKNDSVTASSGNNGGAASADPNHILSNGWVVYDHECVHTNAVYEANGVINVSITNTGSEDWHVQLKNSNISLEQGKYYQISYEVKSSVARNIGVVVMRDGTNDDNWASYSTGDSVKAVGTDWTSYSSTFQMTAASDSKAIFNFALGKVNGQSVDGTHLVSIKNIKIVEVDAPVVVEKEYNIGDEILADGGAITAENWYCGVVEAAAGSVEIVNGKFVADITNVGTENWHVQIKQDGLKIEKGATYEVKLTVEASTSRNIAVDMLSPDRDYDWIGGSTITVGMGRAASEEYSFTFTSDKETDNNAALTISLGAMEGAAPGRFVISNISVKKVETPAASGSVEEVIETEEEESYNNITVPLEYIEGTYKGGIEINPAEYVENYEGKDLKVTITLVSNDYFGGAISGTTGSGWKNGDQKRADSAGTYKWTQVIEDVTGALKVDIWWSGADSIQYRDIIVEAISGDSDNEGSEGSKDEGSVDEGSDESGIKTCPLSLVDGTYKGGIDINPAEFVENYEGKKLKVTVTLISDSYFGGAISGTTGSGWKNGDQVGEDYAGTYTWTQVLEDVTGGLKVDIWWSGVDSIQYKDIKVEEVIEEGSNEGTEEGSEEGAGEGTEEGSEEGAGEGTEEGPGEGAGEGTEEGPGEGTGEGTEEGSGEATEEKSNVIHLEYNEAEDNYKGGLVINPADYVEDYYEKTLRISVDLIAPQFFGGVIGANTASGWWQSEMYDLGEGTYTWSAVVPNVTGDMKIDIWWSGADSIKYSDIVVEEIIAEPEEFSGEDE